ncbi:hypothetical protein [Escherichia coli]
MAVFAFVGIELGGTTAAEYQRSGENHCRVQLTLFRSVS